MKVLRAVATFYPHVTGPAYQAYRISKGLTQRGHNSPIVTTNFLPENQTPGYPPDMDPDEDFPFDVRRYAPILSFDQYRWTPAPLREALRNNHLIHAHGYHNALKDVLYFGNLLKRKPFVLHGHDSFSKSRDPTLKRTYHYEIYDVLMSRTAENADAVVVSTEQEKEEAKEFGIRNNKLHVIPAGKDPETYYPGDFDGSSDMTILFVGRLAPRRNLELLLDAIEQLDTTDIEVRIVGGEGKLTGASERSGYVDDLKSRCEKADIDEIVTFTGSKFGEGLLEEYRNADVFVNPSYYENFGQTTLEAAFSGLPLVGTPTGVATEIIEEDVTGYIISSPSELVEKLHRLMSDRDRIPALGEAARRRAINNYSWDTILDQYLDLYGRLL